MRYESQCVFFCHLHLDWFIDHSLEFPREKSGQCKVGDIPTLSVSIRISARSREKVSMQNDKRLKLFHINTFCRSEPNTGSEYDSP